MASFHFVAAEEYRRRVIQLGEQPGRVFLVGGLGIDAIQTTALLDRAGVEQALDFPLKDKSLLVTFHPATRGGTSPAAQMTELLAALGVMNDTQLIFTLPNADTQGKEIAGPIAQFVTAHPNARAYASLGSRRYLSCMAQVDGVVGNSSSGFLEAPSFGIGTVNIGDRQNGRLKAESIIDCTPQRGAIGAALRELYSPQFRSKLATGIQNPYGSGGATAKILAGIRDLSLENV